MSIDNSIAPTLTIVGNVDPSNQRMQDFAVVSSLDCIEKLGRYLILVEDTQQFQACLNKSDRFLYHALVDAEIRKLSVSLFSAGSGPSDPDRTLVGVLVLSAGLIDHPLVSSRSSAAVNIAASLMAVVSREESGELGVDDTLGAGCGINDLLKMRFTTTDNSYIALPQFSSSAAMKQLRELATRRPVAHPDDVCNTFIVNPYYGHAGVFHDYCGVPYYLPVNGQIQHGWVVPGYNAFVGDVPGEDIGLAWCPEDVQRDMKKSYVIGSPYLYLPRLPSVTPIPNSILSIPMHGIHSSPMAYPWGEYADWLVQEANRLSKTTVTVCLHPGDYTKGYYDFISRGIRVVTAAPGGITTSGFLHRVRSFIRQHEIVTSNRIGTALFYAAYEDRDVRIGGPIMGTNPPDRGEEFTADMNWTRAYYPGFFVETKNRHERAKRQAEEVLGVAYKRTSDEIRKIMWGWYYG